MTLHIYGQQYQHDDAYIAGTREALLQLQDTITLAMDSGQPEAVTAYVNDGEGFQLFIIPLSELDADKLTVPYTDEIARDDSIGIGPWELAK